MKLSQAIASTFYILATAVIVFLASNFLMSCFADEIKNDWCVLLK